MTVAAYMQETFSYQHSWVGACAGILAGLYFALRAVIYVGLWRINWSKR